MAISRTIQAGPVQGQGSASSWKSWWRAAMSGDSSTATSSSSARRSTVAICSAGTPARARFHFLTAKRSSVVQMSSTHVGRTADPAGVVEHLMTKMVRVPAPSE